MKNWVVEYDNAVDIDDEGNELFSEWWVVRSNGQTYRAQTEQDAHWLAGVLNGDIPLK